MRSPSLKKSAMVCSRLFSPGNFSPGTKAAFYSVQIEGLRTLYKYLHEERERSRDRGR